MLSDSNEKIQNNDEETKRPIKIVLQGGQGNKTTVLAKKTTKIKKLLDAYCKERNVNQNEYRLVYKGKVLHLDEPIDTYNMQKNDVIDVVASQTGGTCFL